MADAVPWLLLMHQLPPQPDYFRVKIWRRLKRLGAVALKQTVYVLPNTAEAREDFEWLMREITAGGGEAILCEAALVAGISDEAVHQLLREAVAGDLTLTAQPNASQTRPGIQRESTRRVRLAGAVWVTRQDIHVDRIACAWLIRRAIDTAAEFKFVSDTRYIAQAGEFRFDMYAAEFTHVGADCSFETLLKSFGIDDHAMRAVADVVHDLDLKDDLYGRPETAEVARLLAALYETEADDCERVVLGGAIFEDLYLVYSGAAT